MAYQFSILTDVKLDTNKRKIQSQLNQLSQGLSIKIDSKDMDNLGKATEKAAESAEDLSLSYQAANAILRKTVEIVTAMTEQVYELDGAVTEFRKVSDLSGRSLDNYVAKLSKMGSQVARTGKPKRLARSVEMGNQR